MSLRITTLGTLRVERDGQVLDRLPAARLRCALLVHLAVEREVTRDEVMGLFWADRPPGRARHLLSQTLYELRQELGETWMESSGEQLRVTGEVEVDAVELARAVDAGDHDRALQLYQGRFLNGGSIAGTRGLEGWVDAEQARLTRLHRTARRAAIEARVEDGRLREALGLARRWVELDPLDDEAQHRLIELLAATGDRSAALRRYDAYAQLVADELELEPLDETKALVQRIREGEVGPRAAGTVVGVGRAPDGPGDAATTYASVFSSPAPDAHREAGPSGKGAAPGSGPGPAEAGSAAERAPGAGDGLLERIARTRHRPTVQWTLTYLAAAIIVLEGLDLLTHSLGWRAGVLRMVALLLGVGAIVVLGLSWYRLEQGRRFGKAEAAITFLVAVFLLSMPAWFSRATTTAATDTPLDPNRLAVLYFNDLSPDGSLGPMAAGFTEALIHELSKVDGLDVLSRRAVEPYRADPQVGYDSIVSALQAGLLVEGSMTRVGDRIRLTIQLVDGSAASPVVSTTLESPADSADRLLGAMPEEAARLLRQQLGDQVRLQEMETAATSARALELVQRAEPHIRYARRLGRRDLEASLPLLDQADSMLAEAEQLDPEWPEPILMRARVAEARALATADVPTQYEPTAARNAIAHLDRVLEKWPDHAPALAQRGNLYYEMAFNGSGDEQRVLEMFRLAEDDLRAATTIDRSLAEAWWGLSKYLLYFKAYAEARQAAVQAIETDAFLTNDVENLWHLFLVMFDAEDHSAAKQWCDDIQRLHADHPAYPAYCELFLLTTSPVVHPDVDRAWEAARTIVAASGESNRDTYRGYTGLQVAKVLIRAGMPDSARAVVRRAIPQPVPDWASYDLAHVHLLLGEEERALDVLEQWFEWNPVRARRLSRDWWFEGLHGDPRFEALVDQGPD